MPEPRDLDPQECERLLRAGVAGRVAVSTPDGPHIVPVSYAVVDDTIVVRTSSYSVLGTYGRNAMLAFEVSHLDPDQHVGWSVVARGRGWAEVDPDQVARLRNGWQPRHGRAANRNLYFRIRWDSITGRSLTSHSARDDESPVHRTLTAM
jgi:nitroimidazol reductase NimA-like FMN-containing flavoprotein (pyridoxamine 5'-phosphate oxidase superfamily)